ERRTARRHVTRHHAPGADQHIIANGHARQDDRPTTNPDVAPDADRPTELQARLALCRLARMIRGEYLHTGADLGPVTDGHRDHIQDHAIEIEEYALAQADIEAVIATERRPDVHVFANRGKALDKQLPTLIDRKRNSSVVAGDRKSVV